MEYEIEIKYDKALKDPKQISKRVEQINNLMIDMATSYYIEKKGNNSKELF